MRRREFITLLGGAAAAWPLAARAEQAERVRRVGVLAALIEPDPEAQASLKAFREELQRLGWKPNRNISLEHRWAGTDVDRLRTYAAELVKMELDVILAAATPSLAALHHETCTIPIVFAQVSDPVKLGFVANLARPGGNVTGFTGFEHTIGGKWLELLKDTAPATTRVAVYFDPENPNRVPYLQAIEAAAPSFGLRLTPIGVRNPAEIERTIGTFAQEPNGALIVIPNAVSLRHRDLFIALAARHRLPAVYPYRFFASAGGLVSYGLDLPDQYRRAASYVDLILRGTRPGDLPIQLPTNFELVVNLKTARALGLTIPEPFLQHADEVIE
jgi:putative tryptophan/tyrosine transport system substrate-binding protein